MKTRLDLLDSLPKHSIGAELGVFAGDFSAEIIKRVQPFAFYMVDLFEGTIRSGDQNGENMRTLHMGDQYEVLTRRMAFNHQTVVCRQDSVSWLRHQMSDLLDWLYIDSSHLFEHTRDELHEAFRVVKSGGFICGHDFHPDYPGVIRAVNDFVREMDFEMEIFQGDRLPSFKIGVKK